MFPDFIGEGTDYGGCHDSTDPESPSGLVEVINITGDSFEPSEVFIVSVKVVNFSEAASQTVVLGFANGDPGRGDNNKFSFNASYIEVVLDGVGNSSVFYFEVTGPDSAGNFTLIADALWKNGLNIIQFASGELSIDFVFQFIPGYPIIENYYVSEDIVEVGTPFFITVEVYDLETIVTQVLIEYNGINHSMTNTINNTYEYALWNPTIKGVKEFKIYAIDTSNNIFSLSKTMIVEDTLKPLILGLDYNSTLKLGNNLIIEMNVTDFSGIQNIFINIDGTNYSMTNLNGNTWQMVLTPTIVKTYEHTVFIVDNNNNTEIVKINYNVIELFRFFWWNELSMDLILIFGYVAICTSIYIYGIVYFISNYLKKKREITSENKITEKREDPNFSKNN